MLKDSTKKQRHVDMMSIEEQWRRRDDLMIAQWDREDSLVIEDNDNTDPSIVPIRKHIHPDMLARSYLPRLLSDSIFPRRNSYMKKVERVYGQLTVSIESLRGSRLPHGIYLRKLFIYAVSQAVRTGSRTVLFPSEKSLLEDLGLSRNQASSILLRDTINRATNCYISIQFNPNPNSRSAVNFKGFIFSGSNLIDDNGGQLNLFASHITFSKEFYESLVVNRAVPYPSDHIKKIRSAFVMDFYLWARLRLPRIDKNEEVTISYNSIVDQFASIEESVETKQNLIRKIRDSIKRIDEFWGGFSDAVTLEKGRVVRGVDTTCLTLRHMPEPIERLKKSSRRALRNGTPQNRRFKL